MNKPKEELTAIAKELERRMINSKHPKRGRPPKKGSKMVQVALWMTKDQRDKLREVAKGRGVTVSAVIRELIDAIEQ
jgi:formate-dependent nitrite reductase cytochrome c552 subunit